MKLMCLIKCLKVFTYGILINGLCTIHEMGLAGGC